MTQPADGVSVQHRVSAEVIGRLIDHRLLYDGNRGDPAAISAALDAFLQQLATPPAGALGPCTAASTRPPTLPPQPALSSSPSSKFCAPSTRCPRKP